ncbi:hypothetical protein AB0876_31810 [Mycobacterium sp. NPDC049093]
MLAVRFLLWSARTGIIALVGLWSTYLVLDVVAAIEQHATIEDR